MRIDPPKVSKPRKKPVKFGEGQGGKRRLVHDLMQAGFSFEKASLAVDTVIQAWKRAMVNHDHWIPAPLGYFKVKKTGRDIYKTRRVYRPKRGPDKGRLLTDVLFNDLYRVMWRIPPEEWDKLLADLNDDDRHG